MLVLVDIGSVYKFKVLLHDRPERVTTLITYESASGMRLGRVW
jgi:hypothetical protein